MHELTNGHTPNKCRGTCKVGDTVVDEELVYEKLPGDIAQRHVLLMDPILATGNSAARAIQVKLAIHCCAHSSLQLQLSHINLLFL